MASPSNTSPFHTYSDRARRASDEITNHFLTHGTGCFGRWAAIRLSDGGSDGNLYDQKSDAVRHQLHRNQCAYVCIPPDLMSARQAENYLNFMEGLYSRGYDLADPDQQMQTPMRSEEIPGLLRAVRRGR